MDNRKAMYKFMRRNGNLLSIIFLYTLLIVIVTAWSMTVIVKTEDREIVKTKIIYVYRDQVIPEVLPTPEIITKELEPWAQNAVKENEVAEAIEPTPKRYGFTDSDIYLMTVLLCGSGKTDGDGEYDIDFDTNIDHDQVSLVLSVVMNRVMSDRFPNTVSEVIWARGQFSPMPRWKNGLPTVSDKSYQIVKDWCIAYDAHDLSIMSIPEDHLYFAGNGKINRSRKGY